MGTYKVLQDIEAEDKLLGPLTLKQFIFAIIFMAIGFVEFKLATTTGLSIIRWPFVVIFLFPMIIFGFLAAPISRDQPNDVWLLARIRYLVKPHTRIWNQDGINNLVTITVPKKLEEFLSDGLAPHEVESRLSALASTLDSRGWAIKNVDVNLFSQPDYFKLSMDSDRLVATSALGPNEPPIDVHASDDILDEQNNATAQHLEEMVQASTAAHREQVLASVRTPQPQAQPTQAVPQIDYSFLSAPTGPVVQPGQADQTAAVAAVPTSEEVALIEKIVSDNNKVETESNQHMKTIQPLSNQPTPSTPAADTSQTTPTNDDTTTSTNPRNPAIINLANNDDLNVATLARQAQRISEADGEVTISLH